MKRNNDGTFAVVTGSTKYHVVQRDGKRTGYHNVVWEENVGPIPKGFVIHHIDKNGHNNDINNLALCTITGHNRIHSHKPWNKGIRADENEKFARLIDKAQAQRKKHFIKVWTEWEKLRDSGMTYREIGEKVGKTRETVSRGIREVKATRRMLQ